VETVRLVDVAVAHPTHAISQEEAAERVGQLSGDVRRAAALARGSRIGERRLALPAAALAELGTIEARNALYRRLAPGLAREAAARAAPPGSRASIGCLVTSSCTGYMLPGWGVELVDALGLAPETARVPLTEAGCAGGVVALARCADYLRSHQGPAALAVAVELCSLSFHPAGHDDNLTASLIFGDGAGAARLAPGPGPGIEVVDELSFLVPGSRDALGFDLTDRGFNPVLSRELATLLPPAVDAAARQLLGRHAVAVEDVPAWLIHPGGARILAALQRALGLDASRARWSWDSMREFGNTSSAAIFDVIRRYSEDPGAPRGWAVVAGFGPGVSVELLLLCRC
jgi:alkylresorcinol/alkylpyrone synthase